MTNNAQTHNFTGRKPSKAQVMTQAKRMEKQGADFIGITWGENWIDITLVDGYWHGAGWIKEIGGDWVARELNHCPKKALAQGFGDPVAFLRDHFVIVQVK